MLLIVLADFIREDEVSRCYELTDGENSPRFFRYTSVKTTAAIFQLNAAIFPVKRR